jgi:hypothetical protein
MRTTPKILDLASALSPLAATPGTNESLDSELMGFTVDQHSRGVGAPKHGSHYSHSSHSSGLY